MRDVMSEVMDVVTLEVTYKRQTLSLQSIFYKRFYAIDMHGLNI